MNLPHTKTCTKCCEQIDAKATVCPHCRSRLGISPSMGCLAALVIFIVFTFAVSLGSKQPPSVSPDSPAPPASEKPSEGSWYDAASLTGKGNQDTESFPIYGNKAKITVTTCCGSEGIGTYSAVRLESESGVRLGPGVTVSTQGAEEGKAETIYRNLTPGNYYVSVISGIGWSVKVEDFR